MIILKPFQLHPPLIYIIFILELFNLHSFIYLFIGTVCLFAVVCLSLLQLSVSQQRKKILRIGKKSFSDSDIAAPASTQRQHRLADNKDLLKMLILSRLSQINEGKRMLRH